MKIQTKLVHSLISISRTQARVRDVSDKLHEMKLACLLTLLSRSCSRWGGKKKKTMMGAARRQQHVFRCLGNQLCDNPPHHPHSHHSHHAKIA